MDGYTGERPTGGFCQKFKTVVVLDCELAYSGCDRGGMAVSPDCDLGCRIIRNTGCGQPWLGGVQFREADVPREFMNRGLQFRELGITGGPAVRLETDQCNHTQ